MARYLETIVPVLRLASLPLRIIHLPLVPSIHLILHNGGSRLLSHSDLPTHATPVPAQLRVTADATMLYREPAFSSSAETKERCELERQYSGWAGSARHIRGQPLASFPNAWLGLDDDNAEAIQRPSIAAPSRGARQLAPPTNARAGTQATPLTQETRRTAFHAHYCGSRARRHPPRKARRTRGLERGRGGCHHATAPAPGRQLASAPSARGRQRQAGAHPVLCRNSKQPRNVLPSRLAGGAERKWLSRTLAAQLPSTVP